MIAYKHDNIVGRFSCKGFDTFGPFKLIGGVSKGHLDEKDIAAASRVLQRNNRTASVSEIEKHWLFL